MKRILIAGIGNIFFGDDAFGCEVARELSKRGLPAGVRVVDFGIRSYDLAFALTDGFDAVIIADTTSRGGFPGELYLIEPDLNALPPTESVTPDGHLMDPVQVLRLAQSLGGIHGTLRLVGCEPATLENKNGRLGLSKPVREAVPRAITAIRGLINDLLDTEAEPQVNAGVPA